MRATEKEIREVLKSAAIAAGINPDHEISIRRMKTSLPVAALYISEETPVWNPLKNIEQAAELVDKLGLDVKFVATGSTGSVEVRIDPNNYWKKFTASYTDAESAVAAYCEAVTLAASFIGNQIAKTK